MEFIERKWLVNLLYKPLEKIKDLSEDQLDSVIKRYPIISSIYDIVYTFKEILFAKRTNELYKWLKEAEFLGIEEISSFVRGIRRDIEVVKNSILYGYNNGLAEGSVIKLKVIKRIMYGHNNFDLLRNKLLRLESKRKIN